MRILIDRFPDIADQEIIMDIVRVLAFDVPVVDAGNVFLSVHERYRSFPQEYHLLAAQQNLTVQRYLSNPSGATIIFSLMAAIMIFSFCTSVAFSDSLW